MIWPRWLAHLLAEIGGYFWIPCPVCGEPFAGFEVSPTDHHVNHRDEDGEHVSEVTCRKPRCMAEGERQEKEFFDRVRRARAGKIVLVKP